ARPQFWALDRGGLPGVSVRAACSRRRWPAAWFDCAPCRLRDGKSDRRRGLAGLGAAGRSGRIIASLWQGGVAPRTQDGTLDAVARSQGLRRACWAIAVERVVRWQNHHDLPARAAAGTRRPPA